MTVLKILADGFHEGGWGMWPILVLLMLTMSILIERSVFLRRAVIDKEKLVALLRSQISAGNIQGAIKVCSGNSTPLTRIVQAGLMRANRSDEEITSAMEEAGLRELPQLEKRTGYLAMLGNLATLAGLLGTITGLIKSFAGVAGVDPSQKATLLSKGISEAMNCTAFGLFTGIIGLAAFAYLNGKTQNALDDIAEVRKNVSNLLFQAKAAMQGNPRPSQTFQPDDHQDKENDSCSSWSTFRRAAGGCGQSSRCSALTVWITFDRWMVHLEVEGRRREADVAPEVADRLGQHPGRDQHLPGEPVAGHARSSRPVCAARVARSMTCSRAWTKKPSRAAEDRKADGLPGDAGEPRDARRPARDHHGPHQVVRRRRRCRPVDEGDDALEGYLGGDELHRVRPRHRYLGPRRPTPSSTA